MFQAIEFPHLLPGDAMARHERLSLVPGHFPLVGIGIPLAAQDQELHDLLDVRRPDHRLIIHGPADLRQRRNHAHVDAFHVVLMDQGLCGNLAQALGSPPQRPPWKSGRATFGPPGAVASPDPATHAVLDQDWGAGSGIASPGPVDQRRRST